MLASFGSPSAHADGVFEWTELPPVPDPVGFAAPFAGISDGALIVAGGSNFSGKTLWSGGTKLWSDRIFMLDGPEGTWQEVGRLPECLAYGVAITLPEGVLCIGGSTEQVAKAEVWLLRRDGDTVDIDSWPALPAPLLMASGALVGRTIYVAGGVPDAGEAPVRQLLALDLDAPESSRVWREVEPWPGDPRMLATAGSLNGSFYLLSGLNLVPGDDGRLERDYLSDCWRYTPGEGWARIADIPVALQATPSPAPTLGDSRLFVLGGDDGKYLAQTTELADRYPGFPATVYGFESTTNSWAEVDQLPRDLGPDPAGNPNAGIWPPIVAPVVQWHGGWVIVNDEARPGARTPRVLFLKPSDS